MILVVLSRSGQALVLALDRKEYQQTSYRAKTGALVRLPVNHTGNNKYSNSIGNNTMYEKTVLIAEIRHSTSEYLLSSK